MTHPIMSAAAKALVTADVRRAAARELAWRTWGPRSTKAASAYARRVLGNEAASITWDALGLLPFGGNLQASARLETVSGQRLELHYVGDGEDERLALRVSCTTCTSQQTTDLTSLEQLGRLLARTPAWQSIDARNSGGVQ
ncbi:DUF6195 family protein [Streptomyces sp. NPDC056773]|uniref:DUF6195 family protein n=1 Tax=unclassified Streptomyces TaxID=2593676 RepID=UPI0036B38AA9